MCNNFFAPTQKNKPPHPVTIKIKATNQLPSPRHCEQGEARRGESES